MYWKIIIWLEKQFNTNFEKYYEYQEYRKIKGGRWNQWEFYFRGEPLRLWIPSCCNYDLTPPTSRSMEPINTENYRLLSNC